MPRTLSIVFYMIIFTLLANPVWADCEAYRNLEGRTWVDGTCMETPLGERWWPHPLWGEGDQAGSTNWYTKPEVVARALAQVKLNRVLKIGQEYSAEMPLLEPRSFSLRIPGGPTGSALGKNQVVWNDEFLAAEVVRSAPSSTDSGTSACRSESPETRTRSASTTALRVPRFSTPTG